MRPLSRERASLRFCCWLLWTLATTCRPVGLCVMRTAVATLFTFCPPGPLLRAKASTSSSVSGMTISASSSSNSGTTSTPAKLVCRVLFALNGDGRTRRWTPASALRYPKAYGPSTRRLTDLSPACWPSWRSVSSILKPLFSQ